MLPVQLAGEQEVLGLHTVDMRNKCLTFPSSYSSVQTDYFCWDDGPNYAKSMHISMAVDDHVPLNTYSTFLIIFQFHLTMCD